ncbi:hypothetical protein X798_07873 [Onchocerca flexuosa]|uniref:V-SNARE coiled-coil homology domain-containing protein n=1 Tax=Onchocerca flexuosa TaxID=387005 RepID=A0A238BKQ3_9BILA|nr:hypothetical protein X798_07873 [Onchocerca flexuosa]
MQKLNEAALHERGEKLNVAVEATERLKENAVTLSQRTGKLVEKYEKKKRLKTVKSKVEMKMKYMIGQEHGICDLQNTSSLTSVLKNGDE